MPRVKAEGLTEALMLGLRERLPDVEEDAIKSLATGMLNFITERVNDGWAIALVKTNADDISRQIMILELELKGTNEDATQPPFKSFFSPVPPSPKGRK